MATTTFNGSDYASAESPLANAPGWEQIDPTKLTSQQVKSLPQGMDPKGLLFQAPGGQIGSEPTAYDVQTGGWNQAPKSKSKGKGFSDFLIPIAATLGSAFLGPEIGLGLEGLAGGAFTGAETLGGALAGAGFGAAGSGLTGGNPLLGALEGGVGGAIGPNIGDITNSVFGNGSPSLNVSGSNPTGTPGIGGGGIPGSASPIGGGAPGVTSAPTGVGGGAGAGGDVTFQSDFPTGTNGATGGGSFGSSGLGSSVSGGPGPGATSEFSPGGSSAVTSQSLPSISGGNPAGSATGSSVSIPNASGANISGGASSGSSFGNFIKDPSFSSFGKALNANSGLLSSAAGLGKDVVGAIAGNPALDKLNANAENLGAQGSQLQSYLASGTLPPGVQGGITQATQSAKAAIRSKYASMGMSGSSAEQQDLANVDANATTQGANIAMQLLSQGVQETGLSSELYQVLMQDSLKNDELFGSALANLGNALGGTGAGKAA